jgi:hypothetical protein
VAPKDQELRAVMTRIPEGLRRRLERMAKWNRRSMNAEIVSRLQHSFDIPDQTEDIVSQIESAIEQADPSTSLDLIKSQIGVILSHLGLPDPVEEAKARAAEARARRAEARKAEEEARAKDASEIKDGEKK